MVERLRPLLVRAQQLSKKVKKPKAQWVWPELLADVEYRARPATERYVIHRSWDCARI